MTRRGPTKKQNIIFVDCLPIANVRTMIRGTEMSLLAIKEVPKLLDATDALAVALCHHFQGGKTDSGKKSWKAFIAENPGRVSNS